MSRVGLHVRLNESLQEVIKKALRLQLPFFQCFLVAKSSGNIIHFAQEDLNAFLTLRRQYFTNVYIHGSYWINLAGIKNNGAHAFKRELELAKKLEFTHMILHPGSATGAISKDEGIDALARALNIVLNKEQTIKIILENSAHGTLSVGGDLHDFVRLLSKLDKPERVSFCIDTAHAYSYGYNLVDAQEREKFIQLLGDTVSFTKIALIHLNDVAEKCGSKLDKHVQIGAGKIGELALKMFALDPRLIHVPMLLELPPLEEAEEHKILESVRSWAD